MKLEFPQGSVLGPILFIAFTADLAERLGEFTVKAYADDTQILVSGRTSSEVKQKLEKAINAAQTWFRENSLQINPSKTEIILIENKNRRTVDNVVIRIEDDGTITNITPVPQVKILGVILDKNLTWAQQVKQVKSRTANVVRHLARTSRILPQQSRRMLYDALVCPHLGYADVVWDGCRKQEAEQLQRIHNFAIKVVAGVDRSTPTKEVLEHLGMVPLSEKRRIHQVVFLHKIINDHGPAQLCETLRTRL